MMRRPGQWLCNLGFHKRGKRSHSRTYRVAANETVTLHYAICSRCGTSFSSAPTLPYPDRRRW